MERKINKFLLKWKTDLIRKPLLIIGTRQVGKTYTALDFGKQNYQYVAYFNTDHNTILKDLFKKERSITRLAEALSIISEVPIVKNDTLLIFDNVTDEDIIKGIKLFGYDKNDYHVIAITSSRDSLLKFRGEEFQYKIMTEMDYEEFLWAIGEKEVAEKIRYAYDNHRSCSVHTKALDYFYDYLITGGLPEVVEAFATNKHYGYLDSIKERVFDINKSELLNSKNLIDIERGIEVMESIPKQLEKDNKKFQYGVLGYGRRAKEFENSINFLVTNQLVYRSYKIRVAKSPLSSCRELDSFKLYLPDDGLLSMRYNLTKDRLRVDENVKQALYENHIAHTLVESGYSLYYYQSEGKAEVNFVIQNRMGKIIPIELATKQGSKVKSLSVFMKKYIVTDAYRITESNFSTKKNVRYLPIYAIFCLNEQLY
ncbi:MAG TPA: ATP-binding protein [Candidatus Onthousia excrementipullorum]|uniref:ATP-binding protein n=1 Tax=Candidatus Onthousia excrementipullorum TaxID=2840884 RepID=A0A9D1DUY4_9FIRM|nr:ATP-binding protein [Candidatus Onthousia excrementipullorum]